MPTAPRRRSDVHETAGEHVWCGVERRDVPIERCVECERLTDVVLRDGVRYVRCRSETSPDDPPVALDDPAAPPSDLDG
jgi:hypothetical protein